MKQITEEDLKGILWKDLSIIKTERNQDVLILICNNENEASRLMDIIKANAFSLELSINKKGAYILTLEFTNSEYYIGFNTDMTEEQYPPLKLLRNMKVTLLSAGYWIDGSRGRIWYRKDVHPLESINLN